MKRILVLVALLCCAATFAAAQNAAVVVTPADQKFDNFPGYPTCVMGSVLHGAPDSDSGVVVIAKATAGCKIPWHFHTPNEQVGVVSGMLKMQMKDGQPHTMVPGSYAFMPAKSVHMAQCTTACTIFVAADGKFDIHYVNAAGSEITPDEAIKPTGKAVAKAPAKSEGKAPAKPAPPKKQ